MSGYLTVTYETETTGGDRCFVAYHPELGGCMATGETAWEGVSSR